MNGAVVVVALGLLGAVVCITTTHDERVAKTAMDAEVLIDGRATTVHIIVDKRMGKQWRAVYYDRAMFILPGSDLPIMKEKQ